jgi:hypothetical protein
MAEAPLGIVLRAAAAVLGGYGLAASAGMLLAAGLPAARLDAAVAGLLASFPVYAAAVLWAFAARSPGRAWLWLAVPTALLAALTWLLQRGRAG